MIARILRWLWLAAVLAAAAAAWGAIHLFGARIGPWAAGLAGVLAVVALHPLAIAANFVLSRVFGDPVPPASRLTLWQAVGTYDAEIDASLRGMWFATPFLGHRPAPLPRGGTPLRPLSILFIHGYFCNRAIWGSFMDDAAARGYVCDAVTLPDPFAPIDSHAPLIDQAIAALQSRARDTGSHASQVVLVGHSMGGLVARVAVQRLGSARIAHVITLGTPHQGTFTARFGRVASVLQMRPGSPWLAALAEAESAAGTSAAPDRITTLFSRHDDIVYPQETGALEGATRIEIAGCGHVALAYDRRVRALVFARLDAIASARADRIQDAAAS